MGRETRVRFQGRLRIREFVHNSTEGYVERGKILFVKKRGRERKEYQKEKSKGNKKNGHMHVCTWNVERGMGRTNVTREGECGKIHVLSRTKHRSQPHEGLSACTAVGLEHQAGASGWVVDSTAVPSCVDCVHAQDDRTSRVGL